MAEALDLLKDEKFYSKLELYLSEINKRSVSINERNRKECVKITLAVVNAILEKLKKEDPDFMFFFNRITYVGSFFDGLRVSAATEFDLNVNLKIPCAYEQIRIENCVDKPGFVRVNVKSATIDKKKLNALPKICKKWIDENGYLLHNQILRWFESVLTKISDKGKHNIDCECGTFEVLRKKNGPASTLHISKGNFSIDIDLVPVIEFPQTIQPPKPVRWLTNMAAPWAVVPKPMTDPALWRLSFPVQEQQIMIGQLHLKYINRLIKKFRDANKIGIPSYYIKTLFLWEAFEQKQKNNETFWRKPVSYLFVYMLVKLADSLEKKSLKFFWHPEMNLYDTLRKEQLVNMEGQVKRIISKINKSLESENNEQIRSYLFKRFDIDLNGEDMEQLTQAMSTLSSEDKSKSNENTSNCILH